MYESHQQSKAKLNISMSQQRRIVIKKMFHQDFRLKKSSHKFFACLVWLKNQKSRELTQLQKYFLRTSRQSEDNSLDNGKKKLTRVEETFSRASYVLHYLDESRGFHFKTNQSKNHAWSKLVKTSKSILNRPVGDWLKNKLSQAFFSFEKLQKIQELFSFYFFIVQVWATSIVITLAQYIVQCAIAVCTLKRLQKV